MPASRWQTSMTELFEWIGQDDEELRMLVPSVFSRMGKMEDSTGSPDANGEAPKYPDVLPILPLRGVVVYPQTAVPLTVGQPRSVKLVDEVVASDKLVGLVAAVNPELEVPGPNDLFKVGVIATVHRLLRAPQRWTSWRSSRRHLPSWACRILFSTCRLIILRPRFSTIQRFARWR